MTNNIKNIWRNRQKFNFDIQHLILVFFGGFLGIFALGAFSDLSNYNILLAPFGASCVLIFAIPDSTLAQPRNVIFGHLLTSLVGLLFLKLFGFNILSVSLAVGVAIALMKLTGTIHPPAGANPIVVMVLNANWYFLISVFIGSIILVVCGIIFSKINKTLYPKYWI
ncbi:MAG: hypothetical protein RL154_626 [Pseudomonadota bacterium]|jgi:CBS-domain-containing membrane protein